MGGSSSRLVAPKVAAPMIDYNAATFSTPYVQQLQQQAQAAIAQQAKTLEQQTGMLSSLAWKYSLTGILVIALVVGVLLLWDVVIAPYMNWPKVGIVPTTGSSSASTPTNILYINSAKYGAGSTTVDVSTYLNTKIVGGTSLPSFTVSPANVGLGQDPVPGQTNTLYVTWYVGTGSYQQTTVNEGESFPTLPTVSAVPTAKATAPSIISSIYNSLTGSSSSGDLIGTSHDASTSTSVSGSSAPISTQGDSAYGMQWWMFVKDWNYGFGKKKSIIQRPDSTNAAVMNPDISLHPTDNSLQVAISLFPSGTEAGKSTPAPAGHSSSTDDVFVCTVPNIPLQAWFSVSVTVFGRNVDIYIDGKLVKSCLLPGVPKPAVGDIQLTPNGGFSGQVCNLYHFDRMLTPGDAASFYSAGTSCTASGSSNPISKATGYSVKFGVYDTSGKEVQEYSF